MTNEYEAKYSELLTGSEVPKHMHDGLVWYITRGVMPGSFMEAVLSNDLKEACMRADMVNRYRIFDIVLFLYTYAPRECWGHRDRVQMWEHNGGLVGLQDQLTERHDIDAKETT